MIDVVDPDFNYTAGEFCRMADRAVEEIDSKGKIPVFVGGTGLYIDSYFKGMSEIPKISESTRIELDSLLDRIGLGALYSRLEKCDPVYASKIHHHDRQRIIRAFEVFMETGKPLSQYHLLKNGRESGDTFYVGLFVERTMLRSNIDARVDQMISDGFFEEVLGIREMGYSPELKSMKSIGYNEINDFYDGKCLRDEAVEKIKTVTKQYAKRQMTWFRKNKKINWYNSAEALKIYDELNKWQEKKGGIYGEATK